jgi:addiction module HigA family antidote
MRTAIHPGEILADELEELGVSAGELSRQIDVPLRHLQQILRGKRAISGEVALRLGHWFQTSGQFWLNLQSAYELDRAAALVGAQVEKLPTRAGAVVSSV